MNASELSEQVRQNVEAGEWARAMTAVAEAWRDASEFGTVTCGLPEYADVWVRFRTSGYPFSLRKQWEQANDEGALDLILPRVVAWNLRDVDGLSVDLPEGERQHALQERTLVFDNVDDALVVWMIRAFFMFWRRDLTGPRKN